MPGPGIPKGLLVNYCSHCGASVTSRVPPDDDRPRFVCDSCETIHYQNPVMVVGCIPEWQDRILLCRRAIEPRSGLWTVPAGFLERGETIGEGAVRETWEEARTRVDLAGPFAVLNLAHISQVYFLLRARMRSPEFSATHESSEVKLLTEEQIPWKEIAFGVVRECLRRYFEDRRNGRYRVHLVDLLPDGTPLP